MNDRLPIEILEDISLTANRLINLVGIDETGLATVGIFDRDGAYSYGPAEDSMSALINELVDLRDELASADGVAVVEFELEE
jgi:hypothetical protein